MILNVSIIKILIESKTLLDRVIKKATIISYIINTNNIQIKIQITSYISQSNQHLIIVVIAAITIV